MPFFSEEIFDFSAEQLTSAKAKNLKNQLCGEFSKIFELCNEVLQKANKESLILVTLQTLLRFLNWVPLGYIFETDLISMLRQRFLEVQMFRNVTIKCLTEIGSLAVPDAYQSKLVNLYMGTIEGINNIIPISPDLNLARAYENGSDEEQEFVQNLALFLTSFFTEHLELIESQGSKDALLTGHSYLLKISKVEDREVFKICLEYWNKMVAALYRELPSSADQGFVLNMGNSGQGRRAIYSDILSQLRVVMIEGMVRPEEVLIVENDEGEIVREFVKETDTITLYKSMKECLVYLTHLDPNDTEEIMADKLARQVDRTEWSWSNLNKLCWAIGSVSGAMTEEHEKRFLVYVIKDLLTHTESVRGKDNKAVVASNIMYIVGQYPRFLKSHWKFLKTVVLKLFEFMHELHEGVQDMACDTFIKIAQKCKRHFVILQPSEKEPFIDEMLLNLPEIISDLQPSQVHTFFEAAGCIITAQTDREKQEVLIKGLMEGPNAAWDSIIGSANQSAEILNDPEQIRQLANILKTNVAACTSIGNPFIVQIARIFMDMLNLYKAVSELISQAVAEGGLVQTRTPRIRGLRTIKKEVLKLVQKYISKADDFPVVVENLIPPLLEAILLDYQKNVEQAREAEVLAVMATTIQRLGSLMSGKIAAILDAVFECTLNMINKDFQEYPEHRVSFFNLLKAINENCFDALLALPPHTFSLIIDSIIWAFKHTMRDIADTGLIICQDLLNNIAKMDKSAASGFYENYYITIFQEVFYVLTDREHKSGFKYQAQILAQLCSVVDSGLINGPLYQPAQVSDPSTSNSQFIRDYLMQLLLYAFPNLLPGQVKTFVVGLFERRNDMILFKQHLRDFLIQLKQFQSSEGQEEETSLGADISGTNVNAELFREEREAEDEEKRKKERENALKVPGLLKPQELDEDGMGMQ